MFLHRCCGYAAGVHRQVADTYGHDRCDAGMPNFFPVQYYWLINQLQSAATAALDVVITAHVAEFLREAGPKVRSFTLLNRRGDVTMNQGAHVKDIARVSNVDPSKLGQYQQSS